MIDVYNIWTTIIKNLNSIDKKYLFIKANTVHNLPPYPYCVVNATSPYVNDKDMQRGTVQYVTTLDGLKKVKMKEPQMVFSLTFYSDNQQQVFNFIKDTKDWLETAGEQILFENDIILLECTPLVDKTSILETQYVYKWGFDIRIRVNDVIEMNVDAVDKITLQNETNDYIDEIEIEGGI